jgi:glutathione peroxidase
MDARRASAALRRSTLAWKSYVASTRSADSRCWGSPCNQFGAQEPGSAELIGSFCERNYGVSFPIFAKVDVNVSDAHPLYQYLKSEKSRILGTEAIKWNFTKFLVDRQGR